MKEYLRKRQAQQRRSCAVGLALTVLAHGAAVAFVSCSSLKYIWPPAEEQTFLLDFTEAEPPVLEDLPARQPVAEVPDKTRDPQVVQKSESPVKQKSENSTPEAARDGFGDVETPAPEPAKPKLDARASFPGMARRDTSRSTTPHSADVEKNSFREGQTDGNTTSGPVTGKPYANVPGREVEGLVIKPVHKEQERGVIVVKITVDSYGNVTSAIAGVSGSTITSREYIDAARKAALETRFNQAKPDKNGNIPPTQEGTITYTYNLK